MYFLYGTDEYFAPSTIISIMSRGGDNIERKAYLFVVLQAYCLRFKQLFSPLCPKYNTVMPILQPSSAHLFKHKYTVHCTTGATGRHNSPL